MREPATGGPVWIPGEFIGRAPQLTDLKSALRTSRLIVLTGPPGVGKTRLAREVGVRRPGYRDGACFVELAAVPDPSLVPIAVARALSVWEQPERPVVESIVARLRSRRLLLLLDNCEHVLHGCGELAERLLADCPRLSILVTSQEALGVAGERVMPVAPLAVPPPGAGADALARSEAVLLFCSRAVAARSGFEATEEHLEVIGEICRRLDGIPLAIELAAARVIVLSLPELATRLDQRFAVLTGDGRAGIPRHQTLRTALAWSYGLLSEPEQAVLRALSVFPAGCRREAVAGVAGRGPESVGEHLSGLVSKSLVLAERQGSRTRYRTLETVRLFSADRLIDSGEAAAVRARQAHWCLALAERAESDLCGAEQICWLDRLDQEDANLSAALTWAQFAGEAKIALRLAGALIIYWRIRGHFREGLQRLTAALELDPGQPAPLRAKALWGIGLMQVMLGNVEASWEVSQQSLALAREEGSLQGQARALLVLGNAAAMVSARELGLAITLLSQSAECARQAGDGWCLAHALGMAGFAQRRAGDTKKARALLDACLREGRRNGDQQSLRLGLLVRGALAVRSGELDSAESLLREGLDIARSLREPYAIAVAHATLGKLFAARGEYANAREMLGAALGLHREQCATTAISDTVMALAQIAHDQGDVSSARAGYREVFTINAHCGALLGLGELAIAGGDMAKGRRLLVEASAAAQPEDSRVSARCTAAFARLARAEGDFPGTISLQVNALKRLRRVGDTPGLARALEEMAGVAVELGAPDRAARLFGAASALRGRAACARPPVQQPIYEGELALTRAQLGGARFEVLRAEGAAWPVGRALTYAARWKGTRGRTHVTGGWAGLTMSERRIASLVAQGMTNAEVGACLGISPHTVRGHLTRAFAALGISSRQELRSGWSRYRLVR